MSSQNQSLQNSTGKESSEYLQQKNPSPEHLDEVMISEITHSNPFLVQDQSQLGSQPREGTRKAVKLIKNSYSNNFDPVIVESQQLQHSTTNRERSNLDMSGNNSQSHKSDFGTPKPSIQYKTPAKILGFRANANLSPETRNEHTAKF